MTAGETVSIYALVDPDTQERRYVGYTSDTKKRLYSHVGSASTSRTSGIVAWLKDLRSQGKKPKMEVLETVPSERGESAEKEWILRLYNDGANLLNDNHIPRYPNQGVVLKEYIPGEKYVIASEAASLCRCSKQHIHISVENGVLPCVRRNPLVLFLSDVEAFKNSQPKSKGGRPKKAKEAGEP